MVNYLFKSKESVANCITDRATVHTGNASERFLHHNRTLIPVHIVPEQLLKRSKTYPVQCEHSLISLPVWAEECEKTLQNNIHQDTQLDDGHGGDLNDLSYLLCILMRAEAVR